ncbi:MAG: sensor histidine kinase [bacterium]
MKCLQRDYVRVSANRATIRRAMYKKLCRVLREHPLAVDTSIALAVAALLAAVSVGGGIRENDQASAMVLPTVLSAIVALPLFLRRRHPYLALAGTLILTMLAFGLSSPVPPVMLAIAVALYTVGDRGYRIGSLIGAAAAVTCILIIRLIFSGGSALAEGLVRDVAWIVGSSALGYAVASRRAYVEEFKQRALHAERTREEEAQRRVNEERLRIARDVHDGVAHALASISLQASAGGAVLDSDPEGAREALRQIRGASVSALAELRATLGVLRQPVSAGAAPAPSLEQLAELADVLRAGGIEVSVSREGGDRTVPTEVGNVAYRILQEALTNVLRHSGARHADVKVRYDHRSLTVSVADDGNGRTEDDGRGAGYGITGMRERAEAVGGSLEAGPESDGGFAVRADLPLGGAA